MTKNERAYNLAQDWIRWLDTRKFYGQPERKNILAMLMQEPHKSQGEPNADNSTELHAFNLAVSSLPEIKFVPFVVIYCDFRPQGKPIKLLAHEQGCNAANFYERAHKAASEVLHIADKLSRLHEQMRLEVEGVY